MWGCVVQLCWGQAMMGAGVDRSPSREVPPEGERCGGVVPLCWEEGMTGLPRARYRHRRRVVSDLCEGGAHHELGSRNPVALHNTPIRTDLPRARRPLDVVGRGHVHACKIPAQHAGPPHHPLISCCDP